MRKETLKGQMLGRLSGKNLLIIIYCIVIIKNNTHSIDCPEKREENGRRSLSKDNINNVGGLPFRHYTINLLYIEKPLFFM